MNLVFRLIVAITVAFVACSCSPQQRLSRLVKKHPHLITKDTLTVRDTITIPQTTSAGEVKLITDTLALNATIDSIFASHKDTVYLENTTLVNSLKVALKRALNSSKHVYLDTTITAENHILKLSIKNGAIYYEIISPETTITTEKKVTYDKIEVAPEPTFLEKAGNRLINMITALVFLFVFIWLLSKIPARKKKE
jgi:hypothetical protein